MKIPYTGPTPIGDAVIELIETRVSNLEWLCTMATVRSTGPRTEHHCTVYVPMIPPSGGGRSRRPKLAVALNCAKLGYEMQSLRDVLTLGRILNSEAILNNSKSTSYPYGAWEEPRRCRP